MKIAAGMIVMVLFPILLHAQCELVDSMSSIKKKQWEEAKVLWKQRIKEPFYYEKPMSVVDAFKTDARLSSDQLEKKIQLYWQREKQLKEKFLALSYMSGAMPLDRLSQQQLHNQIVYLEQELFYNNRDYTDDGIYKGLLIEIEQTRNVIFNEQLNRQ